MAHRRNSHPPVISSPYGNVTERMRYQAALNMRNDTGLRDRVEKLIATQSGLGAEAAREECRRRYPEAYPKEAENA